MAQKIAQLKQTRLKIRFHRNEMINVRGMKKCYRGLPITGTLANSNLALTRAKIDFPWISVIHLL